ncbi:MAG TPA: hypothetical protein VGO40_15040 [Longimicrobium sp.]|jgi:hypothetical protein|nr:hypothetical protein [Longimicrobium sp.]
MPNRSLRTSALALAGILIGIGGCTESPSAVAPAAAAKYQFIAAPHGALFARSGESSSAVIGPEGGVLVTSAGHRIEFPAGALATPTTISITANARYAGVELEPHGLRFPAGREPVLTLNTGGADLSRFGAVNILYVGSGDAVLDVLPTEAVAGKLQARLQHFSGYIGAGS